MTDTLTTMKCVACRGGEPTLSEPESAMCHKQVPDWQIVERDEIWRLERVIKFKNFVEALAFTKRVGELAEAEGHHPRLTTQWGRVNVAWWTHVIKGLHRNDFIMSAKTDQVCAAA